jgi:hypothetical protein
MPEGIIRDPKQNPRERNFGIVFCIDPEFPQYNNKNYRYVKEAQKYTRLYMGGEAVIFEVTREYQPEQYIDDIKISGEAAVQCYSPSEQEKAPVIQQLTRPHPPNARATAVNNALRNGMPSDFGDEIKPPFPAPPNCP